MGWRTAVLAICLVATGACRLDGAEVIRMPEGLIGTWQTDSPDYAGRFFTLSADEFSLLLIGTGTSTPERYHIASVTRIRDKYGMLHTIEYADAEGTDYHMGLYYDPEDGGRLRLKNQRNMIWRRMRR